MEVPTPEDFEVIKAFGVDFFKQVANVDHSVAQPSTGLGRNASDEFKNNLLMAEQMVKQVHQPIHQQVVNPYPHVPQYQPVTVPIQVAPSPQPQFVPVPPVQGYPNPAPTQNGQLELNLNPDHQEITTKLLKEILIKLTKILDVLTSNKDVTKLNVKQNGVQKVPFEPKKNQ